MRDNAGLYFQSKYTNYNLIFVARALKTSVIRVLESIYLEI